MPPAARHAVLFKRTFMDYSPKHKAITQLFGRFTKINKDSHSETDIVLMKPGPVKTCLKVKRLRSIKHV